MPSANDRLTVLVSSTSEDLHEYRAVARNVILDLNWHPRMMEHFGTGSQTTVEACRREVEQSDLVLLLMAFRQGWVPTVEQGGNGTDSITALELQHARQKHIPVLALLATSEWPGNLWESSQGAREWVERFREGLNLPAVFFDRETVTVTDSDRLPAFRAKVRQALVDHKERLLAERASPQQAPSQLDYFGPACDGLLDGSDIPFIGMGIYGTGPLSSDALARALEVETRADERSLATVAEYHERLYGSRAMFLTQFRRILQAQSAEAAPLPVYDLIASLAGPRVVVCATFDGLLEARLAKAGKRYVVIAHILRSDQASHDGKLLVVRPDAPADICLADTLTIEDTDVAIYRPLGSPFLHDALDPDLDVDTVVVTETDHLTFLGRLENQHMRIPDRLAVRFKRNPLLFLGYALDVWQYRLVVQVFHSVGTRGRQPVTRAVRVPGTHMEEVAWKRLNADLVRMDPNDFARRAVQRGGATRATASPTGR